MSRTTKSRKRSPNNPNKTAAIKGTAAKFEVTDAYVRMCIAGDAKYGRAEEIKKHYEKIFAQIQQLTAKSSLTA
ncbi:MAG TPA: hypothetical protein PKE30_13130 [Niabella sp.]|nr:hypothetical protein [Niabella sp.]